MKIVFESGIEFGTSGWRAIVADEFTVANIRLAVAGIAAYVKTLPGPYRVLARMAKISASAASDSRRGERFGRDVRSRRPADPSAR